MCSHHNNKKSKKKTTWKWHFFRKFICFVRAFARKPDPITWWKRVRRSVFDCVQSEILCNKFVVWMGRNLWHWQKWQKSEITQHELRVWCVDWTDFIQDCIERIKRGSGHLFIASSLKRRKLNVNRCYQSHVTETLISNSIRRKMSEFHEQ